MQVNCKFSLHMRLNLPPQFANQIREAYLIMWLHIDWVLNLWSAMYLVIHCSAVARWEIFCYQSHYTTAWIAILWKLSGITPTFRDMTVFVICSAQSTSYKISRYVLYITVWKFTYLPTSVHHLSLLNRNVNTGPVWMPYYCFTFYTRGKRC